MTSIKRWLAPPHFVGDEEKNSRARLINAMLLIFLLYIIILLLSAVLLDERIPPGSLIGILITFLAGLQMRRELFRGKITQVGIGVIVFGLLSVTLTVAGTGTIRATGTTIYIFFVIFAGILFGTKGTLAATIAASLAVAGIILAEKAGVLPPPSYTVTISHWVTYTFMLGLAGYITYFTHQITMDALSRARKEIEERKLVEEALRESEARYRSLFEQTHDAVFILNLDGCYLAANQRAEEMLGYTQDEILRLSIREVSAESEASMNVIARLIAGEHVPIYERLLQKRNGQVFPVDVNIELVRGKDGKPLHIQSLVRDISQRKQTEEALKTANEQLSLHVAEVERLHAELREQALHDPLTGLYNRRYLSEMLEREILRAEREAAPLSIVVSDLDHFKKINDAYGHQVGDKFLLEVAHLMKISTRYSDLACRYGGEEFVLVFPGASLETAMQRAEAIRQKCAEITIWHEEKCLSVTMSFGVASYPIHGKDTEEIIIKADKAMYKSKQMGRNRVTTWDQDVPAEAYLKP